MCTSITIRSKEGDLFFGRTMDFEFNVFDADSQITAIPRGCEIQSQLTPWQAKYTFIGVNVNHSNFFFDGVNEKGLTGDFQYLEECSWSSKEDLEDRGLTPLLTEEVVAYILSNFASVQAIKEHIGQFGLLDEPYIPWEQADTGGIKTPVPSHFTFCDPTGEIIILEPVEKGAFKVYDSIGVMTNSPEYPWHLTNLRNYVGVHQTNVGELHLGKDLTVKQIENGSGLIGLPGDYTSPSRFLRSTFLSKYMDTFLRDKGVVELFNLFRSVMVPLGVEHTDPGKPKSDFTGYWIGYDVSEQTLYIQPEDCPTFTVKKLDPEISDKQTWAVSHEILHHDLDLK